MHGPPKVGKTQFVDQMPGPVFFMATEFGHRYINPENLKILQQLPSNGKGWQKFLKILDTGYIGKKQPKTIAIDTTNKLYERCLDFVCEREGIKHPSDDSHGKGWDAVRKEFGKGMERLAEQAHEVNATLVFIDHTMVEKLDLGIREFTRASITMGKQCRAVIVASADHVFYLGYGDVDKISVESLRHSGSIRKLWIGGDDNIEAGTRDKDIHRFTVDNIPKDDPYGYVLRKLNESEAKKHGKVQSK